jgi:hypothetical protein
MVRGPEEVSEIRIHDPLRPALYLFPHFAQGILRGSPSPISEASIIEYRLEDGLLTMGALHSWTHTFHWRFSRRCPSPRNLRRS